MKLDFFKRSAPEQALIIRETAARRGLLAVMVEKDFWVSWTLAVLFTHPEFGGQLVFKGGTSLSKVFGVIERFSEDIDLSVSPAFLGISEEFVEQAESRNKRTERMEELEGACIERVRDRFLPELERIAVEVLGNRPGGVTWMEFHVDAITDSLLRDDLRQRVADWKSRFFAASWARYDLATPGTFRLVPPKFRLPGLEKDYHSMRDMFLNPPPPFEKILETVRDLENCINRTA